MNMEKFVSYEKLSKKKKRDADRKNRTVWAFDPRTRQGKNKKAYDRKKARRSYDPDAPFFYGLET